MKRFIAQVLCPLLAALPFSSAISATVTLTATEDTSLFQVSPNFNLGRNQTLASGGTARNGASRAILRFDLEGQIPPGAIVTSAELELTVILAPLSAVASTFGVHRLLKDWGEGTGGGGTPTGTGRAATTGEATWNARFHSVALWDAPGGKVDADYVPIASATAPVSTSEGITPTFESTPDLVADIQQWVDDPTSNFGWMLLSQSESTTRTARRFGSREYPTAGARPRLTINYEFLEIQNPQLADNQFRFDFLAQSDRNYKVEQRDAFGIGDWSALTNIGPLETASMVTVTDDVQAGGRFYRVKRLPFFILEPLPVIVTAGGTAQFTAAVSGSSDGLTYQWQWNGEDIPGANSSTLTIENVQATDLGDYRVVVSAGSDTIISRSASLMLLVAPFIVEQPQSQTNNVGATVTFTVTVTNTATLPIGYRWRKGSQTVSHQVLNARTSTLTFTNLQLADTGNYAVVVTNMANANPGFISTVARLEVIAP